MTHTAHNLLSQIDTALARYRDVAAHGVALLDGDKVIDSAGFSGLTLAAPAGIAARLKDLPSAPAIAITNDPYASGVRLDHLFLIARNGKFKIVAALKFDDFGAMRDDVFRRRAETFHEGLNLSMLTIDWSSPERDMLLGVIAANIRNGAAMRDALDETARWLLAASERLTPAAPATVATAAVSGKADGQAKLAGRALNVTLDCSSADWRLSARLAGGDNAASARCAAASLRSAMIFAVADALSMPPVAVLAKLTVETGGLAAVAPEAVNDGGRLAFACYQAAFQATTKLSGADASPRDEASFRARRPL